MSNDEHGPVRLGQAFVWTCPECGHEQFERAIELDPEAAEAMLGPERAEADQEMVELLAEDFPGTEPGGGYLLEPCRVRCRECGRPYQVEHDTY